jgi:hypothetical protein
MIRLTKVQSFLDNWETYLLFKIYYVLFYHRNNYKDTEYFSSFSIQINTGNVEYTGAINHKVNTHNVVLTNMGMLNHPPLSFWHAHRYLQEMGETVSSFMRS